MAEYMHAMPSGWKNRGRKPVAFDFAVDALIFLAAYPVLSFILSRSDYGSAAFAIPLNSLAFLLITTFIRRFSPGTLVYFSAVLAAGALAVFCAPGLYARLLTGAFCAAALIYSASVYVRTLIERDKDERDLDAPPVNYYVGGGLLAVCSAVMLIFFFVAIYYRSGAFQLLDAACCCVFLTLYVIYQHMSGSQAIRNDADETGSASLKKLGRRITLITAFIVPAAAAAIYFIYIFSGLSALDRSFVSLITTQHDVEYQPPAQTSSAHRSNYIERLQQLTGNGGRSNPAVRYALDFLFVLIGAAVTILLAYMIFKKLRSFFSLRKDIDEVRRSVFNVRQTSSRTGGRVFPSIAELLGRSNSIRIRRLYKRMVLSSQSSSHGRYAKNDSSPDVAASDAPLEILDKIGSDELAGKATAIYERARYGVGEPDAAAAEEMKRLTDERSKRSRS